MFDKNWRALYAAAVLEVDPVRLELRVRALEAAIRARQSLNGEVSIEERKAMQDALDAVGVLKESATNARNKLPAGRRLEPTKRIPAPRSN